MTSVDELSKKPGLPSGPIKRKFEAQDPQQAYKASKLSSAHSPNGTPTTGATVEDATEGDDDNDEKVEAGPELPPEDGEESFFGGGVTRDSQAALDYLDGRGGEETFEEEKIDNAWLRRLTNSFERTVKKNAELRARYAGEPQKFMSSEADLDAEIKSWSLLAEHTELYAEFAESEAPELLVGLLAHENTDVAITAIQIISELVDEDVEAEQEQWDVVVDGLLNVDLLPLLMSNLDRLDEVEDSDRGGVYHTLAVLESLSSQLSSAEKIGTEQVLNWLCKRAAKAEAPVSQNKQYAAEVLQLMLQSSPLLRRRLAEDLDGVDLFLQLLAAYRRRDPAKDSAEEEYAENLFDALTCVIDEPVGKVKFLEGEGVELCLIMLKEGTFSKSRALRLLDHACAGRGVEALAICEKLVDAAGLKPLSGMFMKKADSTAMEHLLGMFSSLLRTLPGESAARIRTLAKFTETGYKKISRLVELRQDYARKVALIDKELRAEKGRLEPEERQQRADEWFSRRLDGGLFCLQTGDVILAWLAAEDSGAKDLIARELDLETVKRGLQDQLEGLGTESEDEDMRDMLVTLVGFLD